MGWEDRVRYKGETPEEALARKAQRATYAKPDGILPIDEARANYRQGWADKISEMRMQAERTKMLPRYHKELKRFGGEGGALDYFSSDYFFGTTPLGKKYKEAGLLGEVTK